MSSDLDAIRRLLAVYSHCYDDGRADDFGRLFAPDAAFTVLGRTYHGPEEIRDGIGAHRPGTAPGQHVTYNSVIDVEPDGTHARGWTDFAYVRREDDGRLTLSTAGRYHDTFLRIDGRWRFASRAITFLGEPGPDAEPPLEP